MRLINNKNKKNININNWNFAKYLKSDYIFNNKIFKLNK